VDKGNERGNGENWAIGYGIATDPDRNIYVAGSFTGTIYFNPGSGKGELKSIGAGSAFIQKLDVLGQLVWVHSFGSTRGAIATEITVDGEGNVYAVGEFGSPTDFDPGPCTNLIQPKGFNDVFILKMDPSGTVLLGENNWGDGRSCG